MLGQKEQDTNKKIWMWMPSLYIMKGLPISIVMLLSTIVYKRFGLSSSGVLFLTSWLMLAWVLKPLWRPMVDTLFTRRVWVIALQIMMTAVLYLLSTSITNDTANSNIFMYFLLLSFVGATHEVAVENYYIERMRRQVSKRTSLVKITFYMLPLSLLMGVLIMIEGNMETLSRQVAKSWSQTFLLLALLSAILTLYHIILLRHKTDKIPMIYFMDRRHWNRILQQRLYTFFMKPSAVMSVVAMLLYPMSVVLFSKISILFLFDRVSYGGMGLSPQEFSFVEGTIGAMFLLVGIVCGQYLVMQRRETKYKWLMTLSIIAAESIYLYLSYNISCSMTVLTLLVSMSNLLIGFGFMSYMNFLYSYSQGRHSSAHHGIALSIMMLSFILTSMFSGYWQEAIGYKNYFILTLAVSLLAVLTTPVLCRKKDVRKTNI